ncbi:MAG: peptide synthase [Gemmatales bacterium]|nr:MAG: peptide synthase [Gemmatales bacterium]
MSAPNIADSLVLQAQRRPVSPALYVPKTRRPRRLADYACYSFRELNNICDQFAHALTDVGVQAGMRTVLMVKPGLEFFALTFALFKIGAVPVFIDPGMGIRSLGRCLAEVEPSAFVGIAKAQLARILFGWAKKSLRLVVTVGRRWGWGGFSLASLCRRHNRCCPFPSFRPDDETPAAILFTSGSTGPPKGAVYTHPIFVAQVELLKQTFQIAEGEIDVTTFPLFALFAPALGMTGVVPVMDATRPGRVDPRNIITPIQVFGANNLFGSPALLRRVGEFGVRHHIRLPTLKRVLSAGAPVPVEVLETFQQLLADRVPIFTPYGATEALPVCVISSNEVLNETRYGTEKGAGTCVGKPISANRVGVIRIDDGPIACWSDELLQPAGEIGEIVVQGPIVSRHYFGQPEAETLAKIPDPASGSFYHRMGDVGYFDNQGRLWFCGRKSQRVITENGVLFTAACEGIFNTHPQVRRSALVGIGQRFAQKPVLCVEPEKSGWRHLEQLKRELLELARRHPPADAIQEICFFSEFPVDIRHNSKIFREKLADLVQRRLT